MIGYRRDIDGLRALAVIPVVLFHAGVTSISGGFIGVDIFFVISGYLITQQLLASDKPGWQLLVDFYERRIRRIAPALLVMLLVLLAVTAALMPSVDLLRSAKSAIAALFFAANIRLFLKTGYFDDVAEEEPLLNTWSLAVEEQFYLVFPLLLLLLRWLGSRSIVPVLALLAAASLAISQTKIEGAPSYAFYLLPSRAWELLAGALLAAAAVRAPARAAHRELLAIAGFLVIIVPMFTYSEFTPFPGLAALAPVGGAVALITAGGQTLVGRALSVRPMVWIGLISYSLYLWHWPIFVVSRQVLGRADVPGTILLIAASLAVAFLSYRYVERPFRNRLAMSNRRLIMITGAAATVVVGVATATVLAAGWPGRSPRTEQWQRATMARDQQFQANLCLAHGMTLPPLAPCRLGTEAGSKIDGILWGDSHAAHWAPMLDTVAAQAGLTFREVTKKGCPPILTRKMFPVDVHRIDCPAYNRRVLDYVLATPEIRYVILSANWQGMTEGFLRISDTGAPPTLAVSRANAARSLTRVAAQLRAKGKIVLAIGQTPIPDKNVILCVGRRRFLGYDESSCALSSLQRARARDRAATTLLGAAAIPTISPLRRFCDDVACYAIRDGRLLYIDAAHLSDVGASLIAPDVLASLRARR